MPYTAIIQQTEQIPNDPPRMGAKSTTNNNHPSTPRGLWVERDMKVTPFSDMEGHT